MSVFRKALLIAGVCFSTVIASPSFAACDISGNWSLYQDNGFTVYLSLGPDGGDRIRGTAYADGMGGIATVVGWANGPAMDISILWTNGSIGNYHAQVDQRGVFRGTTGDQSNPGSGANWHSLAAFYCS